MVSYYNSPFQIEFYVHSFNDFKIGLQFIGKSNDTFQNFNVTKGLSENKFILKVNG